MMVHLVNQSVTAGTLYLASDIIYNAKFILCSESFMLLLEVEVNCSHNFKKLLMQTIYFVVREMIIRHE